MTRRSRARVAFGAGAFAAILAVACGESLPSASEVRGLRVLAVTVDPPIAHPGETATLEMTYHDALGGGRPVQIAWIAGCYDPPGDLYYACGPALVRTLEGAAAGDATYTSLVGTGPKLTLPIPKDLVARHATPASATHAYGLAYAFFLACAGEIRPAAPQSAENATPLPLGCFDRTTGEPLPARDAVVGYTSVFVYDSITNANPKFLASEPLPCATPADCPAGLTCPSQDADLVGPRGACVPKLPACERDAIEECPGLGILPRIDPASVEPDVAAAVEGETPPNETLWVSYFATNGKMAHEARLVNEPRLGRNPDFGTVFRADPRFRGIAHVWAILRDNRGGTAVRAGDVVVE